MAMNKIETTYGLLVVIEDDMGAVTVSFNTDEDIMIEMKASNSLTFHAIEPRTSKILTKKNLKEIDKLLNAGGESQDG